MLAAELQDLSLGQGEWKNMQNVIRKTFKLCLEKQYEQSQQIANLNMHVTKLREDLNQRPTWADMENMIMLKSTHDNHIASFRSKQGSSKGNLSSGSSEIEDLKFQVMQLKSDCEKRATIQSMQTQLSRKADRTDLQSLRESTTKLVDNSQDFSRIKLDIAEVKSEVENLSEKLEEAKRIFSAKSGIVDLSLVKVQLEGLHRRVSEEMLNRDEINSLLNQKINRSDADKILATKADSQSMSTVTTKIEDVLAEHERQITALRLSVSDPSLFSADFLSKRGPIMPPQDLSHSNHAGSVRDSGTGHSSNVHEHHHLASPSRSSSRKTSASAVSRTGIQDSKLESIISGLWNKMNAVIKEHKQMKEENSSLRKEVSLLKDKMDKVAAAEKMELLAVVLEEQRLRLDAVIQGSTKIYPIFKELKRMDASLKEIEKFLSLPQPRCLHEHLKEMTSLLENLSQRLVELSADVHSHQGNKVDTLISRTDAIEARVESCLVDRERIAYLMDQVDTTDTRFGTLRDMAQALTELWNLLLMDGTQFDSSRLNGRSVVSRVKEVETKLREHEDEHGHLQHRIEMLKDALASYGLQVEQQQQRQSRRSMQQRKIHEREKETLAASSAEEDSSPEEREKQRESSARRMQMSDIEIPMTGNQPSSTSTSDRQHHQKRPESKHYSSGGPSSRKPTVDFDAAISALYASLEDVAIPVRVPVSSPLRHRLMVPQSSSRDDAPSLSPISPTQNSNTSEVMLMSITEVDERLAELQREKQRLRQMLVDRV